MNILIKPSGNLPPRFTEALGALETELGMKISADGITLKGVKSDTLSVAFDGKDIVVNWAEPVQFYRALSLLPQPLVPFTSKEIPCFKKTGIMFDASRNAVPRVETICFLLLKMSIMGLNLGMMYTEDTYEVPGKPYFGYQRGRYSIAELRQLDDYADMLGIELCPCIQTLGHLNRALHWPAFAHLKDNEEVLLADNEETYEFLEKIIAAACKPYRSKRIHIGMDEAHGIGLGNHLKKHGFESPHKIIRRHLSRVLEITKKQGLSAMMWSDMYFRPDSPTNSYYDTGMPSDSAINSVNSDVSLVYWDYYHDTEQEYTDMLKKHQAFHAPTVFAGGIWTWCGPAPDYTKTFSSTIPALTACKKMGVPFVIATAWGDNGAETNIKTTLLGMQLYAEFNYAQSYDKHILAQRFERCCGTSINSFLDFSQFNTVPGMHSGDMRPVNAAKFLLYQDPLVQLYNEDTKGLEMAQHYAGLKTIYQHHSAENVNFKQLFDFYVQLADVLSKKCFWHENASRAVIDKNIKLAAKLVITLDETIKSVETLRVLWRELWNKTNKYQGFEIIDLRLGGVKARLETASERMDSFAKEKCNDIPELSEAPLPYTLNKDGVFFGSYAYGEIVSACKIDT